MPDYYEMLGVSPNSETEVITAAYRALMRKYHPDISRDPRAGDKARQINEAYRVLSSQQRRREYDSQRKTRESQRSAGAKQAPPPPPPPPPRRPASPKPGTAGPIPSTAQGAFEQTAAKIRIYDVLALTAALASVTMILFAGISLDETPEGTQEKTIRGEANSAVVYPSELAQDTKNQSAGPSMMYLASLADSDWGRIGEGCVCAFTSGESPEYKLIAGGRGMMFFRLNGEEHLCPAPSTIGIIEGALSSACGSTTVHISPFGKVDTQFGGRSSNVQISISLPSGDYTSTGRWDCYC